MKLCHPACHVTWNHRGFSRNQLTQWINELSFRDKKIYMTNNII